MMGAYARAAKGAKNVASKGGADVALSRMPQSRNVGYGRASLGNPAGYNAAKSTYIQNNKAGYQARFRGMPRQPGGTSGLAPRDSMPNIRVSDYRKSNYHGLRSDLM